jgi:hypothetical protein
MAEVTVFVFRYPARVGRVCALPASLIDPSERIADWNKSKTHNNFWLASVRLVIRLRCPESIQVLVCLGLTYETILP